MSQSFSNIDVLIAVLWSAAASGLALLAVHVVILRRHLAGGHATVGGAPPVQPPISILKPLCGLDDGLAANLMSFATLPYPAYEVLLGVRGLDDAAYPLAWAFARRWPQRFRVIVQEGEPGLNPKVNQLLTLERAARHELLLISDSNTRAPAGYLAEIADLLADPQVGLVTHPLAGLGEGDPAARLGAALDNLHLTTAITPSLIAAKRLCGKDYVVGKSMALRRRDLERLGGFAAVKDVLAEDFVLGRLIPARLGKRVVMGRQVVTTVAVRRSLAAFVRRYARWSVMQRRCAGLPAYLGMLLLNPLLMVAVAAALAPGAVTASALGLCALARAAIDAAAGRLLRRRGFALRTLLLGPLKDLLMAAAWLHGLTSRTIEWRSHRLTVLQGSVLRAATPRWRPGRARSEKAPARAAA